MLTLHLRLNWSVCDPWNVTSCIVNTFSVIFAFGRFIPLVCRMFATCANEFILKQSRAELTSRFSSVSIQTSEIHTTLHLPLRPSTSPMSDCSWIKITRLITPLLSSEKNTMTLAEVCYWAFDSGESVRLKENYKFGHWRVQKVCWKLCF